MNVKHGRIGAMALLLAAAPAAYAVDFALNAGPVPAQASGWLIPGDHPCDFGSLGSPLGLAEAVGRALCNNPKTREAWAQVKAQAAAVGAARAAYLPTMNAQWQALRDDTRTDVLGQSALSTNTAASERMASLSMNWVLFDFGARGAALRSASETLAAARASQDATLQDLFAQVARVYYAAQAAQGALDAAREVEGAAQRTLVAAQARVEHGVAPISDVLQARTQHDDAVFNLTQAEGDLRSVAGTLASAIGLAPDTALVVPSVAETPLPNRDEDESVASLIDEVKVKHPSVVAAQAQFEAAEAKVSQTRAEGLANVSLIAKYSLNSQPVSPGLGSPSDPAKVRDAYVGVQVSIPLFEGFGRHDQIRQARAEAERLRDVVDETAQQVALDVWTQWQTLRTAARNVNHSQATLTNAELAFDATEHRYAQGVGSILELLNTQTALANARQKHVQALADWYSAKLQLAGKLGRLEMTDTDPAAPVVR